MIDRIRKALDLTIGASVSLLTITLVICVVWQVFSRFVLSAPSTTTDEIARFLLMWCGLTGSAYMVGRNQHLSIELFATQASQKAKALMDMSVQIVIALFSASVMIYGGVVQVNNISMTGQLTPSMGIPMSWIYAVLPVTGIIIVIYNALNISDSLKKYVSDIDAT